VTFDAGDVIIVPFPFTDRATTKRRPALVLSNAAFNTATGHVIAAMITSAKQSAWESDVAIADLGAAGLSVPCVVRMKLFTLEAGLVVRKAGRLGAVDAAQVRKLVERTVWENLGT
jgi:mRNA interferase MazF